MGKNFFCGWSLRLLSFFCSWQCAVVFLVAFFFLATFSSSSLLPSHSKSGRNVLIPSPLAVHTCNEEKCWIEDNTIQYLQCYWREIVVGIGCARNRLPRTDSQSIFPSSSSLPPSPFLLLLPHEINSCVLKQTRKIRRPPFSGENCDAFIRTSISPFLFCT